MIRNDESKQSLRDAMHEDQYMTTNLFLIICLSLYKIFALIKKYYY
jgi:hypothetical protein